MRALPLASGIDFGTLPDAHCRNPLWVAQQIVRTSPSSRAELHRAVAERIADLEAAAVPSAALGSLASTQNQPALVLTLNYDRMVENAARAAGRQAITMGIDEIPSLLNDGLYRHDDTLRVLHLHGSLDDPPEELVLDAAAYTARADDQRVRDLFVALLPFFNLCIIGTSFEEQYLATVLQARRPVQPRHVIVCDAAVAGRILDGTSPLTSDIHNILVCDYPADEHAVLDPFCERLVRCIPEAEFDATIAHAMSAAPSIDQLYEPRRFVDPSDRTRSEIEDPEIAMALGRYRALDEDELRAESRAVVIGPPGGGKSSLLEHLASSPSAGERAVLVRLRDVRQMFGEPLHLLAEWMAAGTVLDGGGPIATEALAAGTLRVHLLLDGLDELPGEDRLRIAATIVRIGAALPDQRLTVSSRPSTALEVFAEPWRQLELLCDAQWRSGLLARGQVNERDIADRLGPLYRVFEPLLRVPLFLRGMLDLMTADQIPTDGLDLALTLLRRILDEDPQLRAFGTTLEFWLTRVALTMALGASVTLSSDQLRELAAGLELGDPAELAELLANRSLLLAAGDEYAFHHRVFGEALVANHLLTEEPQTWLDVMAPRVDGQYAILRDDWAGVAELLLPRSEEWRTAMATRDPRAAARATPVDASRRDRARAARYLWTRAQQLEVWIDRCEPARTRSDGDIVSSLIRSGGLKGLAKEVRSAVFDGSRFQRGNAVEVVVEARLTGAEALLRRVLVDDADSVVRRAAASGARRLRLRELLGPLERRALSPEDEAEATDLASVVLTLTPPRERIDVALRLTLAGNREVHDWKVVEGLSPAEQLRWLALRSRRGGAEDWWVREHLDALIEALPRLTRHQQAQLGRVLAYAGTRATSAVTFLKSHPNAAIGLIDAIDARTVEPYEIIELLVASGSVVLAKHGASTKVLQHVRMWEQAREQRPPLIEPPEKPRPEQKTLSQVMAIDNPNERLFFLLKQDGQLVRQVADASPSTRAQMETTLDDLWGEQDLRDGVESREDGATIAAWAQAVLQYGPALGWSLEEGRWTQVATCGWLWEPQVTWLRAQAHPGSMSHALSSHPGPRAIGDLAALAGDHDLTDLVSVVVAHPPDWSYAWSIDQIVQRLVKARRSDLLRRLADHAPWLADRVRPSLAASGDVTAQREQLEALLSQLASGSRPDRHSLDWVDAIEEEPLFALVAEAIPLAASLRHEGESPFEDIAPRLQAAAERIDLTATLALYDRFISTRAWTGAQFLVERRDHLIQELCIARGQHVARTVAGSLGLPA